MEGECRGPGSSRKKRPNRLFQLNLSMAINGFLAIACNILPIVLSSVYINSDFQTTIIYFSINILPNNVLQNKWKGHNILPSLAVKILLDIDQ